MKTKRVYSILLYIAIYLFAAASFFFLFSAAFQNAINDFRNLALYLPLFLTLLVPVVALFIMVFSHRTNGAKFIKLLFICSIILLCYSLLTIIYTFVDIYANMGGNYLYRGITSLFPLDVFVYNAIYVAIALVLLFTSRKMTALEEINYPKKPIWLKILGVIFVLCSLFFLGNLLFAPTMFDFSFKHIGGLIPVYLLMLVPTLQLVIYWFIYPLIKEEKKDRFAFHHALYMIGITLILFIWFLTYELFNNSFIVETAQSLFPISFAVSLPIGFILLFLLGVVPGIVTAIILLVKRHKSAK